MKPIQIPGTFVVFQGVSCDGLSNTIDSLPSLIEDDFENSRYSLNDESNSHARHEERPPSATRTTGWAATQTSGLMMPPFSASPLRGGSCPFTLISSVSPAKVLPITDIPISSRQLFNTELPLDNDAFVVVSDSSFQSSNDDRAAQDDEDDNQDIPIADATEFSAIQNQQDAPSRRVDFAHQERLEMSQSQKQALEDWKAECRENELLRRLEWYEASSTLDADLPIRNRFDGVTMPWWMTDDGCLAIFDGVPLHLFGVVPGFPRSPIGKLSPGSIVVATELITLSSTDLVTRIQFPCFSANETDEKGSAVSIFPQGRSGWVQILKIESPVNGYCVLSVDGYSLLGPGLPGTYCNGDEWLWRVACVEGAYVRKGLDLSSERLTTLSYGSLVRVKRKTVNAMALSRLQVETVIYNKDGSHYVIEGWISEFLNPLSGQRGPIVLPLPFPVPALYQISWAQGAVIRSGVELSSPIIGHAPEGAILTITGREFSEHPRDQCVARYRLAGNGGWISTRLNLNPPDDAIVTTFTETDCKFEPEKAGIFHLGALHSIRSQQQRLQTLPRAISTISSIVEDADFFASADSIDDDTAVNSSNKPPSCTYSAPSATRLRKNVPIDDRCLICLCEDRTATIVHGETGHVACCLVCARILKARGDPCPVCRLSIDLVVQHFWA